MKPYNFFLVGVGGQGTLLASDVLALVGIKVGYDVKKSEIHGMAQRGGSVTSQVRWAEKVYSPLVSRGEADYYLAFERLEGLRYIEYLRLGGVAIINDYKIPPVSVNVGADEYPDEERTQRILREVTERVYFVPAMQIAEAVGNARTNNVVLLGALSSFLDVPPESWLEVISERVPQRYIEINRQAFLRGRQAIKIADLPKKTNRV